MLQAGEKAPDFDVPVLIGGVRRQSRLSEQWNRRNLVLAFYPSTWDPVSTRQMVTYQVEREKLEARQAEVLGISVDHIMNAAAWEREIGPFDFLLASDFWPHGAISREYGVLRESEPFQGASERAIFVIDKTGKIRFARIYPVDQLPDFDETLTALHDLARI